MYCTQCGCKIEESFNFCPGCGCEVEEISDENSKADLDRLVDEIWERHQVDMYFGVKELVKRTGMSKKEATKIMLLKYHSPEVKEAGRQAREQNRAERKALNAGIANDLNTIANAFAPKSPKKGVAYETKKLSVSRGLVGYGLAGPAGAVLGGLSSKKRQAVDPETGKKLSKREVKKRLK